jgi:hypothetical protein
MGTFVKDASGLVVTNKEGADIFKHTLQTHSPPIYSMSTVSHIGTFLKDASGSAVTNKEGNDTFNILCKHTLHQYTP